MKGNTTIEELGWNCTSKNGKYHLRFATATSSIALSNWLPDFTSRLHLAPNRTRIDIDFEFGPKLDPSSKVALEAVVVSCSDYKPPETQTTRTGSYFGESGFLEWDKQAVLDAQYKKESWEVNASVWTSGIRNISVSKVQDDSMFRAFVDSRCGEYRYFQHLYFTFNDYPDDDLVRIRWGVFVSVGPQPALLDRDLLLWLLLAGSVLGGLLLAGMLYCCCARRCCCKSEDRAHSAPDDECGCCEFNCCESKETNRMTEPLLQNPYNQDHGSYGINSYRGRDPQPISQQGVLNSRYGTN